MLSHQPKQTQPPRIAFPRKNHEDDPADPIVSPSAGIRAHFVGRGIGGGGGSDGRDDDELPELEISDIFQKDIDRSYNLISPRLAVSANVKILRAHQFCRIRLHSKDKRRPPEMFGRILSCRPDLARVDHLQRLELLFPRAKHPPGLVVIQGKELDTMNPALVETALIKVHIWGDGQDFSNFEGHAESFHDQGFHPITSYDTDEFLDSAHLPSHQMPWFYIIGSGWLEQQSRKEVYTYRAVLAAIERIIQAPYRTVINVHTPGQSMILNDILGYIERVTKHASYLARSFKTALDITQNNFDELMRYPLGQVAQ